MILYSKDGKTINVTHGVDARELVLSGEFSATPFPEIKEEVKKETVKPAKKSKAE